MPVLWKSTVAASLKYERRVAMMAPSRFDAGLDLNSRRTIACTGVRESGGFEMENLSRVPGDAWRYPIKP